LSRQDRLILVNGDDDARLVFNLKQGDEKAFDQLFDKYRTPVYSICFRYARNNEDARELAQDVFIKVYRNIRRFNERSKFFTWLYRIAVNTCISFHRKRNRGEQTAAGDPVADCSLDKKVHMKIAIDEALEKVPPRQRITFILHHYDGHTFNEVGAIMRITPGAAKAHYHQAVKKLREYLREWL
jgi:RNA polymerase sigma-70 factor (ECF subfamily)